jgi:hypothetical protein
MDSLIHWDFSPGIKFAALVRKCFRCSIHFSPSPPRDKAFFLVASFPYASFPLSVNSVGLALQCCLGGDALGFRVVKLSDRRFRFSVSSNTVGHFIHPLESRIWHDFHCHFGLFRGNGYSNAFYDHLPFPDPDPEGWSSPRKRTTAAETRKSIPDHIFKQPNFDRSPVFFKPNLDVLR